MTERSRVWDGTTTGDATESPYDAATEFARLFRFGFGFGSMANSGGVLQGATGFSDLAATSPAGNTVRIASGVAWVYGTQYDSDANVDINIPTPGAATRIDRIVLRKAWAAQTVRLVRIAGVEGGGAPALVQTPGTTWDIPVCQVSITTGAVITITDQREYPGTPGIPTGTISMFGGAAAPGGWVLCDGAAINRTTFAALFAVTGTTFGAGNGSTTFNVPDLRSRFPIGAGSGSGLTVRALGALGGEETHALTSGETGAHTHAVTDGTHTHTITITDPNHNHTQNAHNHAITDPTHHHAYGSGVNFASGGVSGALTFTSAGVSSTDNATGITINNTTPTNNAAATGATAASDTRNANVGANTGSTGSGTGHNTIPVFQAVSFIIKT